jgi:hypothetical protein
MIGGRTMKLRRGRFVRLAAVRCDRLKGASPFRGWALSKWTAAAVLLIQIVARKYMDFLRAHSLALDE